jgi:hypothetical protein
MAPSAESFGQTADESKNNPVEDLNDKRRHAPTPKLKGHTDIAPAAVGT